MSSWGAMSQGYLNKLSEAQRQFLLTGVGRKFYHEFIFRRGNHVYVVGDTGSGKTNRGHWLVNWLKYTEAIIWISTGKSDEILPLLFMGKKVNIYVPGDADFSIEENGRPLEDDNVKIIRVKSPDELINRLVGHEYDEQRNYKPTTINILELRNTLHPKIKNIWLSDFFSILAMRIREGTLLNHILPASIFIDESQWVLGGTRITTNQERVKTSEIVTESALEIRSEGGRLVFFAQDFKNITPAIRENMLCGCLNRNTNIEKSESPKFWKWCNPRGGKPTSRFKQNEMRFVFDDGDCYPPDQPWYIPWFPILEADRDRVKTMRVKYGHKYNGQQTETETIEAECFPELGRFQAMAIPPEAQSAIINRWQYEGEVTDE